MTYYFKLYITNRVLKEMYKTKMKSMPTSSKARKQFHSSVAKMTPFMVVFVAAFVDNESDDIVFP